MGSNGSAPDQYAGQYGQHGVECEHHRRSLPGQDDARDDRAQHPRQVDGQGVEGQGRGQQAPLHQVRHQGREHRKPQRQSNAIEQAQQQQRSWGQGIGARERRQYGRHNGDPGLRHGEKTPAVEQVGQRAAGQAQHEQRQGAGRLYPGHPRGTVGELGHAPGGGYLVHPHGHVAGQPGQPQVTEARPSERGEQRVGGGVWHQADLSNALRQLLWKRFTWFNYFSWTWPCRRGRPWSGCAPACRRRRCTSAR